MFNRCAVSIGDALFTALYSYIEDKNPNMYNIEGIYEDGEQKFAAIQNREDNKYSRLNFSFDNETFTAEEIVDMTEGFTPGDEPQFALADIEEYVSKKKQNEEKKNQGKTDEDETDDSDDNKKDDSSNEEQPEDEDDSSDEEEPESKEDDEEDKKKKKKYSLDEIPEYIELKNQFAALEAENEELKAQNSSLTEFKNSIELEKKQEMIESFYMLSDEDKQDVVENINTYSLEDIEAKLSIICVRNKVDFNLDNSKEEKDEPLVYTLEHEEDMTPAWIAAVAEVMKENN